MHEKVTLTKVFTFDTAHALEHYPGKCRHIHGHTYHLYVTVSGVIRNEFGHPFDGMIMDFSELKQWVRAAVVDLFDHALVLRKGSALASMPYPDSERLLLTDYEPSCENMLLDMVRRLRTSLPDGVLLARVKLYETPTSFAEWES
jgi:6-pyruvoyltetrahydropterin/6-carboxytetrahydropterin synthase